MCNNTSQVKVNPKHSNLNPPTIIFFTTPINHGITFMYIS